MKEEPVLSMTPAVWKAIQEECARWPESETGGYLLGYPCPAGAGHATVHVGPGAQARHCPAFFVPDAGHQQREIERAYGGDARIRLLGNWHLHPGGFDRPSGHDAESIRGILKGWNLGSNEFVACIAVRDSPSPRLRAWRMTARCLEFRELPVQVAVPPEPDPAFWIGLPAGREYLAVLLSAANRAGYSGNLRNESQSLCLGLERDARRANISFPAGFPFRPAWLSSGTGRQRLSPQAEPASRLLTRELKRQQRRGIKTPA